MKKKKWEKPKLIILTRGKPEEGVLGACKIAYYYAMPSMIYGLCWLQQQVEGEWTCGDCASVSYS